MDQLHGFENQRRQNESSGQWTNDHGLSESSGLHGHDGAESTETVLRKLIAVEDWLKTDNAASWSGWVASGSDISNNLVGTQNQNSNQASTKSERTLIVAGESNKNLVESLLENNTQLDVLYLSKGKNAVEQIKGAAFNGETKNPSYKSIGVIIAEDTDIELIADGIKQGGETYTGKRSKEVSQVNSPSVNILVVGKAGSEKIAEMQQRIEWMTGWATQSIWTTESQRDVCSIRTTLTGEVKNWDEKQLAQLINDINSAIESNANVDARYKEISQGVRRDSIQGGIPRIYYATFADTDINGAYSKELNSILISNHLLTRDDGKTLVQRVITEELTHWLIRESGFTEEGDLGESIAEQIGKYGDTGTDTGRTSGLLNIGGKIVEASFSAEDIIRVTTIKIESTQTRQKLGLDLISYEAGDTKRENVEILINSISSNQNYRVVKGGGGSRGRIESGMKLTLEEFKDLEVEVVGEINGELELDYTVSLDENFDTENGDLREKMVIKILADASEDVDSSGNGINDAPVVLGPKWVFLAEDDEGISLQIAGLEIKAGPDGEEANQYLRYKITQIPDSAQGTLYFQGTVATVEIDKEYSLAQLRKLAFKPNHDWNGTTYFSFEVEDNGTDYMRTVQYEDVLQVKELVRTELEYSTDINQDGWVGGQS